MGGEKLHFEHLKIAVTYIFIVSQPDEMQYVRKCSKPHHHCLKIVKKDSKNYVYKRSILKISTNTAICQNFKIRSVIKFSKS